MQGTAREEARTSSAGRKIEYGHIVEDIRDLLPNLEGNGHGSLMSTAWLHKCRVSLALCSPQECEVRDWIAAMEDSVVYKFQCCGMNFKDTGQCFVNSV